MGENSTIEWTDHTFNPWIGCARVSPGCLNCYAETYDQRWNDGAHWGKTGARRITSDANWRKPLAWDRAAAAAGRRDRVFCASLADVFEDRDDLVEPRARLWRLIRDTPHLDWLLLTKRPENLRAMLPWTAPHAWAPDAGYGPWPNVWLGTTVEDQQRADERIPWLLDVPAAVRFLSCEPLLAAVNLTRVQMLAPEPPHRPGVWLDALRGHVIGPGDLRPDLRIDWVIAGGESGGRHTRPMHPDWARSLRDQCQAAGVPLLFKQWGSWSPVAPVYGWEDGDDAEAYDLALHEVADETAVALQLDGDRPQGWDKDGPPSGWCDHQPDDGAWWMRYAGVSGKAGGRELDGRTWDEMPQAVTPGA